MSFQLLQGMLQLATKNKVKHEVSQKSELTPNHNNEPEFEQAQQIKSFELNLLSLSFIRLNCRLSIPYLLVYNIKKPFCIPKIII